MNAYIIYSKMKYGTEIVSVIALNIQQAVKIFKSHYTESSIEKIEMINTGMLHEEKEK